MTNAEQALTSLTDEQLLARVRTMAANERKSTADLIAGLVELDARRLYLGEGYSSLFAYCTRALQLSEDAAYNRIRAVRVAAKWPEVVELIANGSLTVTSVRLLSDLLTDTNHAAMFAAATHKTKREVELIVATVHPQPAPAPSIRRLPQAAPSAATSTGLLGPSWIPTPADHSDERPAAPPLAPASPARPATVAPLSQDQYKVQFTISKATHDKLGRVQDLMRHTNPKGDPAEIFDRALTVLLEHLERRKLGKVVCPRQQLRRSRRQSRHIPSAVKREVWARDGGRCAYVGAAGRCTETGFVEYHHVVPYADGGEANAANIQLRCRTHNAYEAQSWFGSTVVRERRPPYGRERSDMLAGVRHLPAATGDGAWIWFIHRTAQSCVAPVSRV